MPAVLVPVVAAIIGEGLAATVVVGSLTVGSLIASTVFTALSVGVLALLQRPRSIQPQFKQLPGSITFEPQAVPVADVPTLRGLTRDSGQPIFRETDGVQLGMIRVLSERPVEFIAHIIDDETPATSTGAVTHNAVGPGGIYVVISVDEGDGVIWPSSGLKWVTFISYVWTVGGPQPIVIGVGPAGFIEPRSATDAGFTSRLISKYFPALWGAPHKLRGLSYVASIWAAQGQAARQHTYPRLYPVESTITRGCPVWDPRDAASSFLDLASGEWRTDNPTWVASASPALHLLDYLTNPNGRCRIPLSRIDLESFKTAATRGERPTFGHAGTVGPFAEYHGKETSSEEPRDVIARFETACDGQVYVTPQGKVGFRILDWKDPTVWLDESAIGPCTIEMMQGVHVEFNALSIVYVERRLNFSKNPGGEARDEDSIASIGRTAKPFDLDNVQDFNQAWRLAMRAIRRANPPRKIQCRGGVRMLAALGHEVVGVRLPTLGIEGVFRIVDGGDQDRANYSFTLHEVTRDMFRDEIAPADPVSATLPNTTYYGGFTPLTPNTPTHTRHVVSGDTVTGPYVAYVVASVPAPADTVGGSWTAGQLADTASTARFRWRKVGAADWDYWSTSLGKYIGESPNATVMPGDQYEIQAWLISLLGGIGGFSPSDTITF